MSWKQKARELKSETIALYFASQHPETPWYAKVFMICIIAYAFSPIDLIPDFIPVLGLLDDLILIPIGVSLALRMIPAEVMSDSRKKAAQLQERPKSWIGALVIITLWILIVLASALWLTHKFHWIS